MGTTLLISHYLVFNNQQLFNHCSLYRIHHDEVLDVFVHGSSGVFEVRVKSVTPGSKFNRMVSNTTGIPTQLYKLFYKNQPLDLNSPVGKQLNHGCSIVLHILGKGGSGGNTSDLQGVHCCCTIFPNWFLNGKGFIENLLYEQIIPMGETSKGATGFQEGAQSKNSKHVEESRSTSM